MNEIIVKSGKWIRKHAVLFGVCLILVAAGAYLLIFHRPHLLAYFPYALFLACPLMHVFMHRSHKGRGEREAASENVDQDRDDERKGHHHP